MKDAIRRFLRVNRQLNDVFLKLQPVQCLVLEIRHNDREFPFDEVFQDCPVLLWREDKLLPASIDCVDRNTALRPVVKIDIEFDVVYHGGPMPLADDCDGRYHLMGKLKPRTCQLGRYH